MDRQSLVRLVRVRHGHGRDQRLAVGVQRFVHHLFRRPVLDHAPQIHDDRAFADIADQRQVVRDVDRGQAQPFAHVAEHVQDAGAYADIQHRDRLVGDDEGRLQDQGAGHDDALKLAAGHLVRIALQDLRRAGRAHQLQCFLDQAQPLGPGHAGILQRLGQGLADGQARVQGLERVLEDQLRPPPEGPQIGAIDGRGITAFEQDGARGRRHQLQQQPAHGRLAATGLAQQPDALAALEGKADAVDRLHQRRSAAQGSDQVAADLVVLGDTLGADDLVAVVLTVDRGRGYADHVATSDALARSIWAS